MRKASAVIILLLVLAFAFVGCTKYTSEPSAEETAVICRYLGVSAEEPDRVSIHVVYNRHEDPVYLLGVSESGYVIAKRSNLMICENGGKNPFAEYMELKKYYGEPLSYTVYDPSNAEKPYHNLVFDTYGTTYSEAHTGQ